MSRQAKIRATVKTDKEGLNTITFRKGRRMPVVVIKERPDALYEGDYSMPGYPHEYVGRYISQHMPEVAKKMHAEYQKHYHFSHGAEIMNYLYEIFLELEDMCR